MCEKVIAVRNPRYRRSYLKPDDPVEIHGGVVILPEEVTPYVLIKVTVPEEEPGA